MPLNIANNSWFHLWKPTSLLWCHHLPRGSAPKLGESSLLPYNSSFYICNSLSSPVCFATLKSHTSLQLHCHHLSQIIIRSLLKYRGHLLICCLASSFVPVQSFLHTVAYDQGAHSMQVSHGEFDSNKYDTVYWTVIQHTGGWGIIWICQS